ncbi:DUF6884 domain-containing protein [Sediminibacillus albus]|uniref:DUF6884 domain-containing protein n=1 Tax=Sediminibacillus albus TaxID=407036 RepID=A0A1G8WDZ0_9BACI|nr:DUF6884 domain-containing protein [Sediminibacillus albus]SDJ76492.1 hypothetical protein SAMN05216243_0735 [Sediminibacillus albus]
MPKLCIIPCGKKKVWDIKGDIGPVPAKEAYIGTLHRLCENYANHFQLDWVVLSAKHGFLLPDDIVPENYDLTFNHKSDRIVTTEFLQKQIHTKGLDNYQQCIVLTGKKYNRVIHNSFQATSPHVVFPLQGCGGIGRIQQQLKQAVENNQALH